MSAIAERFSLVLCEGDDDKAVMQKLADTGGLSGIRFESYGGRDKLGQFLSVKKSSREFASGAISRLLITRDADDSWESAWQVTTEIVSNVFCAGISEPGEWGRVSEATEFSIWIAPGRNQVGMIETLCLQAARAKDPEAFVCLEQFAVCLHKRHAGDLHDKEKFAMWSIAAQMRNSPRKRMSIPRAISRLNIDWDSPVFAELVGILTETAPGTVIR